MKKLLLLILLFLAVKANAQITPNNGMIYVKKGAIGNGSSWANAVGELAHALKWTHQNNNTITNLGSQRNLQTKASKRKLWLLPCRR